MRKVLKKIWLWIDDRTGLSELLGPLARHLVPPDSKWAYVFGSATLFAFIIQIITGVGLSFIYQPSSGAAYDSLKLINQSQFGHLLRSIHYWGSSAMFLLVGIHMIRVYLYAAFKYPREMGWISGIVLLLLTIAMGFTGQLLRWDSNGVWSAIVGAEQAGRVPYFGKWIAQILLGGETLGGASLSRFFAFHVFLIPAIIFLMLGLHLYLVIRNGISETPKVGRPVDPATYRSWYQNMLKEKGVPFWPDAAWRDAAFGIIVVIAILLVAYFIGAPDIGSPPNPADLNSSPKPDWYFTWLFGLFALMPRGIESFFLAYGPILIGIILLGLPFFTNKGERSPWRRPWSIAIVLFMITIVASFWYKGIQSPWSPKFNVKPLSQAIVGNIDTESKLGAELFYKKACLYCHKIDGTGGLRGPDLTKVGIRLTREQLTIRIVKGGGNMPPFGATLSDTELKALVSFLETRR